jgi:hypothetical protein
MADQIGPCAKCGIIVSSDHPYTWCSECGEPLPSEITAKLSNTYTSATSASATGSAAPAAAPSLVVPWAVAGFVIGAILGLLTRPSVPILGQLPIETVLTRGSNLTGMDTLLKSTAEASFNQVLIWVIIGTGLGAGIGAFMDQQKRTRTAQPAGVASVQTPVAAEIVPVDVASAPGAFCIACGTKLPDVAAFCPKCGSKRAG